MASAEIVTAGPYVFTPVWASDYETGVHPEVKVAQWVWWGNEARNEIRFNLNERLKVRLEHVAYAHDGQGKGQVADVDGVDERHPRELDRPQYLLDLLEEPA